MKVNSIQALAKGFIDGGVIKSFNFPGFYSHDLFNELGGTVTSVNEKISYEIAWGACIAGARTVVALKNVGLHDAMDPFLNSYYTGVNAGLVLVVFDDINLTGSQAIFDSRLYRIHVGGVWLEPGCIQECYDFAVRSLQISEETSLPVVIRMSNTNLQEYGDLVEVSKKEVSKLLPYKKEPKKRVVHPITGDYQFSLWQKKNKQILANGKSYSVLLQDSVGIQTNNILEETAPKINYNRSYATDKHIVTDQFDSIFKPLVESDCIISIDLGGYTADYNNSADMCLCFGGATAVGAGIQEVLSNRKVVSIIGDAPFLHSGKNVIPELMKRRIPITIFVLDNGGSQGTGGQQIPGSIELEIKKWDLPYKKIDLPAITDEFIKNIIKLQQLQIVHITY